MPSYDVMAKVDQIVTKEVRMYIDAGSEEEAQDKATSALNSYPEPITVSGIRRMVTQKSTYWIPKSVEFVITKEEKPNG